ncbi:uncharacterized protein EV154DRAFT_593174 [Mucor mucedo]|uniref:uncharacterized protein n=1 Tax=Mucor mucedo TaxID=29922 RepID=UPI00221F3762|nr:uncharacterized protein EV154DRAFT_593174 [Mucor mucedo]KAI7895883.1 hypothetical protein EV154DRAFT_593174 [Mucor mucedo]
MSDQTVKESEEIEKQYVRQFVQLSIEIEANRRVKALRREPYQNNPAVSSPSNPSNHSTTFSNSYEDQQEPNDANLNNYIESMGTIIKNEALRGCKMYHNLVVSSKASVCLGLNSIIDINNLPTDPEGKRLQINSHKRYKIDGYDKVLNPLRSIKTVYDSEKTDDVNSYNLYKELQQYKIKYTSDSHSDIDFGIFLLLRFLETIEMQPHLYKKELNCSEYEDADRFWVVIMERLFSNTELNITWNDAHLTISDLFPKRTDLKERKINPFDYMGPFKDEYGLPVVARYNSNRCKVLLKSKAAINNFIQNGCIIDSVDSLQFDGLFVCIINTTLVEPGFYVNTKLHDTKVDDSLCRLGEYITLASHLLCFRDRCIEIYKQYDNHLKNGRASSVSGKRNNEHLLKDDLVQKQNLIRGNWYPPPTRTTPPPPPPPPKNLFGNSCKNYGVLFNQ